MIKKVVFSLILLVSACSSAPKPEIQYFVLTPNNQTTTTDEAARKVKKNIVVLESIKLAQFLDQPGIILQTDAHQIKVAHYHRWGEPLKRNLHRYISESLTAQMPQHVLLNDSKNNQPNSYQHLGITINQFNGTTNGMALLSGHWTLKSSASKNYSINKPFSYRASLENSGYPELVNQLALLLDQLCKDVATSINATLVN